MIKKIIEDYLLVKSWKGVLFHFFLVLIATYCLLNYYFNSYLPELTKHGQEIEVPDLENKSLTEVRRILDEEKLNFIISDTVFSEKHKPLSIVNQQPKHGAKVKEGRKIYLTINSGNVPKILITEDIIENLKEGYITLESKLTQLKLQIGDTTYVTGPYKNLVEGVFYKGKEIKAGDLINLGSKIDFTLQNGLENNENNADLFDDGYN